MLDSMDIRRIVEFLPDDLIGLMKAHPIVLAGGYVRARIAGEDVTDIDLFSPSVEAAQLYAAKLAQDRDVKAFRTKNAYTVLAPPRLPVQFIHRWTFETATALVESFDFTVAQAAIWYNRERGEWLSTQSVRFYRDLAARRLVYTFPQRNEDVGGSLLRVQKFLKRGYDIAPEDLGKVIARLMGGVRDGGFYDKGETERAAVIVGLLREVDPLRVIDGLTPTRDSLEDEE